MYGLDQVLSYITETVGTGTKSPAWSLRKGGVVPSDKDEEEINMYNLVGGVPKGTMVVNKEAMTVAKLDEKISKRMNDKFAQMIS